MKTELEKLYGHLTSMSKGFFVGREEKKAGEILASLAAEESNKIRKKTEKLQQTRVDNEKFF